MGIETAKGGLVGGLTAAVPGSTALTFGGGVAKTLVSTGNAVAVGAAAEVAAQAAKGEDIDSGSALLTGAGNGFGFIFGNVVAPFARAAATTTVPANPGFQVTSLRGTTFTVGATQASSTTSKGVQQAVQDTAGTASAATIEGQR